MLPKKFLLVLCAFLPSASALAASSSGRDVYGNPANHDVEGNPQDENVQGNRPENGEGDKPKDIYGNETGAKSK